MSKDIPKEIPPYMHDEYLKWKASPKRYESLYPISTKILKKYLTSEIPHEKSKKRPS
jgi:hypothetical protein